MNISVFIADDHYMVVEGIRSLLQNEKEIEWMGHAMNAASCMTFLSKQQPQVLLLDINLPDKSGLDVCKDVKSQYPEIQILGLSSYNQLSYIQTMLDNGASGYLLKNATKEELMEALISVMEGNTYLSIEASNTLKENENTKVPVLTRREKEVLALIADGLTNAQIAERLFISPTTVDTHRTSILAKFEVKNTANLIRMATQFGFI